MRCRRRGPGRDHHASRGCWSRGPCPPALAVGATVPAIMGFGEATTRRRGGDLSCSGLGISLWPNVIPPDISIWEAAAPPETQIFVLIGTIILLPIVLGYTVVTYYVFRGKLRPGEGYH